MEDLFGSFVFHHNGLDLKNKDISHPREVINGEPNPDKQDESFGGVLGPHRPMLWRRLGFRFPQRSSSSTISRFSAFCGRSHPCEQKPADVGS